MFDVLTSHDLILILGAYGYWAVLILVALESTGVPIPGETMLMLASVYAGVTHHLHIVAVIAAAVAGAVLGDNIGFVVGRQGGRRLLQRYGRYVRLDARRLQLGECLFERHGSAMVLVGRFLPFLRIWAAFLAGAYHMPWRRFLVANAAGGALWATLMGSGCFVFGSAVMRLGGPFGVALTVATTLAMVLLTVGLHRSEHRLEAHLAPAACGLSGQ